MVEGGTCNRHAKMLPGSWRRKSQRKEEDGGGFGGGSYTPFSSSRLLRFWISRMVFMLGSEDDCGYLVAYRLART